MKAVQSFNTMKGKMNMHSRVSAEAGLEAPSALVGNRLMLAGFVLYMLRLVAIIGTRLDDIMAPGNDERRRVR